MLIRTLSKTIIAGKFCEAGVADNQGTGDCPAGFSCPEGTGNQYESPCELGYYQGKS